MNRVPKSKHLQNDETEVYDWKAKNALERKQVSI